MPGTPMRAIKTFLGRPGESRQADKVVQMGDDFAVADPRRANDLEMRGLAVPLIQPRAKAEHPPANKMEAPLQNKAAQSGPLPSTGGKTGETSDSASSSAQAPAPNKRGSRRSADKLDL